LSFNKEARRKNKTEKKRKKKKKGRNICTLKRENPSSLSEEEPELRLSGATSGTTVFH